MHIHSGNVALHSSVYTEISRTCTPTVPCSLVIAFQRPNAIIRCSVRVFIVIRPSIAAYVRIISHNFALVFGQFQPSSNVSPYNIALVLVRLLLFFGF